MLELLLPKASKTPNSIAVVMLTGSNTKFVHKKCLLDCTSCKNHKECSTRTSLPQSRSLVRPASADSSICATTSSAVVAKLAATSPCCGCRCKHTQSNCGVLRLLAQHTYHTRTHTRTHTHTHAYTRIHTHTHAHIRTHVHTHTHILMDTHIRKPACTQSSLVT